MASDGNEAYADLLQRMLAKIPADSAVLAIVFVQADGRYSLVRAAIPQVKAALRNALAMMETEGTMQ